jgi:uncharacterized RDD family membrane protein YckC
MRRSSRTPDGEDQEPSLFDLPLESAAADRSPAGADDADLLLPLTPAGPAPAPRSPQPLQPVKSKERPPAAPRPVPAPPRPRVASAEPEAAVEPAGEPSASLKSRLMAGAADLLVHAAIAVAAIAGSRLLGARPGSADWPPIALFLLTFSFLYTVLPLAFWGQTLGMAWAGLTARSRDGEALTFDQTARRWLGALATAATLGLPLLATAGRRSLSDRVSGSGTYSS